MHGTTINSVRKDNQVAIGGDVHGAVNSPGTPQWSRLGDLNPGPAHYE